MLTEIGFIILSYICSLSSNERANLDEWLQQPVLDSGEAQSGIEQFIKKRIPGLEVPETADEWLSQSEILKNRILENIVFKGVPSEWNQDDVNVVWGDVIETDKGYSIKKIRYEALPGLWIPALLYEPDVIEGKMPAILNVNGHVGAPGKTINYEQIRCINLAKRGILALHPEWLLFGELSGADYKHNRLSYLDLCGTSGLSVFYLAMKRGVDFLETYPKTDPSRIAMTGLSGGGWQTIILSSLDTRISVVVPNAGYICLFCRVDHLEDVGDLEQNPVDLVSIADYSHLTAMLAPRPTLLIYNEKDNCCFQSHRSRPAIYEPALPFFKLFGKTDNLKFYNNVDPGTHNYDKDNREQFYRFINRHFLQESEWVDSEIPSDDEVLEQEKLDVGIPEDNANFFTLAKELMKELPINHPPDNASEIEKWREKSRDELSEVLRLEPMIAKASIKERFTDGELKSTSYKISINDEWKIPVVSISKDNSKSISVLLADTGKKAQLEYVEKLVKNGAHVIAIDPLFIGESVPSRGTSWQYSMMIGTVGERPLGIQVGQIGAIIDWVCNEFDAETISLHGIGWNASVAALSAGALYHEKIERVFVKETPNSLKLLVEKHLEYETYPALFCFGLLKHFDISELIALCKAEKVETY